jgi:hypothetical protein
MHMKIYAHLITAHPLRQIKYERDSKDFLCLKFQRGLMSFALVWGLSMALGLR